MCFDFIHCIVLTKLYNKLITKYNSKQNSTENRISVNGPHESVRFNFIDGAEPLEVLLAPPSPGHQAAGGEVGRGEGEGKGGALHLHRSILSMLLAPTALLTAMALLAKSSRSLMLVCLLRMVGVIRLFCCPRRGPRGGRAPGWRPAWPLSP